MKRNGDMEFENIINNSYRAVRQMAACGLGHSAKAICELIKYTKALDKNQKALIKTMLKYQKINKMWDDVGNKMFKYLTPSQKQYIKEYAQELEKEVINK